MFSQKQNQSPMAKYPAFVLEEKINKLLCNLCGGPIVRIGRGKFNLRCLACRSTFIHRALCHVFEKFSFSENTIVYELSVHGSFYKYLKKRYKNLTASDYIDSVPFGTMREGRLIQDVEKLSFFSESFDVVTSTEVFEHVANDLKGYQEVHRVLKPGGKFIYTVPLELFTRKTITRAYIKEDGTLEHILPPEYHGDYLRKGILAFRNYGIDIYDILKKVGFQDVKIYNVRTHFDLWDPVICCTK